MNNPIIMRVVACLLAMCASAIVAQAQRATPVSGRVSNRQGEPIPDVVVSADGTFWQTITRRDGTFELKIPAGRWLLRVRRIGFAPESLSIDVRSTSVRDSINVVLRDAPAELLGVVVADQLSTPAAITLRTENVRQTPALVEPDVMRALPLFASVSQPNDLVARIHLAGGASDEHGLALDGHPMQGTLHAFSLISAFNVATLDRADVLIHHVPSSSDGYLSGKINLFSKRVGALPTREVDVSLASSSFAMSQPSMLGKVDVMLGARLTYADKVMTQYKRAQNITSDDYDIPSFRDVMLKLGHNWRNGFSVNTIGYASHDQTPGQVLDSTQRPPVHGEDMVGLRAEYSDAKWNWLLSLSTNRAYAKQRSKFSAYFDSTGRVVTETDPFDPPDRAQFENHQGAIGINQRLTAAAFTFSRLFERWRTGGGLVLNVRDQDNYWLGPEARRLFKSQLPFAYAMRTSQKVLGLFAEESFAATDWLTATAGAHVSIIDERAFVSPRLLVQGKPTKTTSLEFAFDHRTQFNTIADEPIEGSIMQPVFLLRTPRTADAVSVTANWSLYRTNHGSHINSSLSSYVRNYEGAVVSDTIALKSTDQLSFNRGLGNTRGGSLSVEVASSGGFKWNANYTRERTTRIVDGLREPTKWDTPHQFNSLVALPLGRHFEFTGVAQIHSGIRYTRVDYEVHWLPTRALLAPRDIWGSQHTRLVFRNVGTPNGDMLPSYRRFDIGMRAHWRGYGASWTATAQAINAFWSRSPLEQDGFYRLPVLPSIGLNVKW